MLFIAYCVKFLGGKMNQYVAHHSVGALIAKWYGSGINWNLMHSIKCNAISRRAKEATGNYLLAWFFSHQRKFEMKRGKKELRSSLKEYWTWVKLKLYWKERKTLAFEGINRLYKLNDNKVLTVERKSLIYFKV